MTSRFMGDKIRRFKNIHLGIVVSIEDGLLNISAIITWLRIEKM